jgi:hypothetical protein
VTAEGIEAAKTSALSVDAARKLKEAGSGASG